MQCLSFRFDPLEWSPNVGHIRTDIIDIPLEEVIRGGYYLLHPINGHAFDPLEEAKHPCFQLGKVRNQAQQILVADWMLHSVMNRHAIDHSYYADQISTDLARYNTIVFPRALPSSVAGCISYLIDPQTVVVTKEATYEEMIDLAVRHMNQPDRWDRKFVEKLIYRIGTGTEDDNLMATLDEVRAVLKELDPNIKVRSWKDFREMDLEKMFTPNDFRQMEDVIISLVVNEKIVELEAFMDAFTVARPGEETRVLHWQYADPQAQKGSYPSDWVCHLGSLSDPPWKVFGHNGEVILEPEAGRTITQVHKQMEDSGMDIRRGIPYHVSWKEFEDQLTAIYPGELSTGIQIVCDDTLGKALYFKGAPSFQEITVDMLRRILKDYGIDHTGDKEEIWNRFCQFIEDNYPAFDQVMANCLGDNQLIRVPMMDHEVTSVGSDISLQLARKHSQPLVMDYMISVYLLTHTYSSTIVRHDYVTKTFTLRGIMEEIGGAGFRNFENSGAPLAYVTTLPEFPDSIPTDFMKPGLEQALEDHQSEFAIEDADELERDILGD